MTSSRTGFPAVGLSGPNGPALEYWAFRELTQHAYLRYAQARTGNRRVAERSVHAAFGELSERWAEVLSGDCPAAAAWDMLSRAIADQEKGRGGGGPARGALHSLTDPQADAVLLHEQLQLSDAQAADLMGLRTASLQALLRTADRTMGTDPLAR